MGTIIAALVLSMPSPLAGGESQWLGIEMTFSNRGRAGNAKRVANAKESGSLITARARRKKKPAGIPPAKHTLFPLSID